MLSASADTGPILRSAVQSGQAELSLRLVLRGEINVRVTRRIEDVEQVWRTLSAGEIESPGQSYDFIRLWVQQRRIPLDDQRYVVGEVDGHPVALLPLHRKRVRGVPVFTWFPGANVGGYVPVADHARLDALGVLGRGALWRAMTSQLTGADLVYLRSVPTELGHYSGLFDELGQSIHVETLYRAEFSSWDECDRLQRSRSRRKHDRQQADRLAALGQVHFEAVTDPKIARDAVTIMFQQRSARFRAQGIRDVFVVDNLIGFYEAAMRPQSGVDVRLHVLRLDGVIVAVRYNVVHGSRMFCLISSMSDDPKIQAGSPGKQCLLHVMQSVFDAGYTVFDMGSGFTDEKRHWCNTQIPLRQHYIGLNYRGIAILAAHRSFQRLRAWAKGNAAIKAALRTAIQLFDRLRRRPSDQL